jgi:hypothetical protein
MLRSLRESTVVLNPKVTLKPNDAHCNVPNLTLLDRDLTWSRKFSTIER